METVDIAVKEIKPYDKNAKKHNDTQIGNVAESIRQFGFVQPIVLDKDNVVVIGHCRLLAAKKLRLETVPCVYADTFTDEQVKKLRLLDNKLNESAWDFDLLSEELEDLELDDFGLDWGLPEDEEEKEIIEDTPPEVDEQAEPICKTGDIWQLGSHRLIVGDSTDRATIERLMDGAKADMVLSDPPYGMKLDTDFSGCLGSLGRKHNTRGNKYDKVIGDNEDFKTEIITTFFDNFAYCEEMFLFGADYYAEILPNKNDGSWLCWDKRKESQADAIGSEFELIWSKSKHKRRMLRHDWFGFLSSENAKDAQNRVHPTQKPITLLADIIKQWGDKCDIIVDLYGGSGSTMIACEQLGRKCYMCEIDPTYCDVILKRYIAFKGTDKEVFRIEADGTKTAFAEIEKAVKIA